MKIEDFDLDDAFEDLMRKANPEVRIEDTQYRESRRVFFAGAAAVFYHTLALTLLPEDEAEAGLSKLQKQLELFFLDVAEDKD